MNDLESLRKQIRFQLAQLRTENAHHQFEDLCRHLTRHRICSNILPATGPVAGGGDQGRDFETFRTYLAKHRVGDGNAFIGLASAHPLAFACSMQQENISSKIKEDVATIMRSGTQVEGVHFFCEVDVQTATRHNLQDWARKTHDIHLEVYDGRAISELLSQRDTYWIGVRYLGLPDDAFPASGGDEDDWYPEARKRWQAILNPSGFADFQELSDGARRALHDQEHREDLPFWIERIRTIAADTSDRLTRHRSIAEIAALSIRGLKTFADCDELVRAYFDELDAFPDALDLEGAAVTYNYTVGALGLHVTSITSEELNGWRSRLLVFVDKLLAEELLDERPNRHADLLDVRGYLAFSIDVVTRERASLDEAIGYWKQLLDIAPHAPLYRITRFADHLTQFATILGDHKDFAEVAERTDALVAKRHGGFAAASKARDRAMQFYNNDDLPRAISELHRARVNWFAKETLGGSILAFLTISSWYREIGLNFAAKYYAFAAAFIAVMSEDSDVRKRFPQGLALAAESDYQQGAWCGYLELVTVAEKAAFAILPTTDREVPDSFKNLILANAMVTAITERLVPARVEYVTEMTSPLALHEFVIEILDDARKSVGTDENELRTRIAKQLVGPPFSDDGEPRSAGWNTYGSEWRIHWKNTHRATAVAEEFCAVLQIFLAEIHAIDLYLLATTVDIEIDVQDGAVPSLKGSPSNETRRWKVTLPPNQTVEGFHDLQQHIFAFGVAILTEISLLSHEELLEIIEGLYKKGLSTKTIVARPYSELFHKFVPEELFASSNRSDGAPAATWHPPANTHLPWNDSDGWSYELKDAIERVQARYDNSLLSLRFTLPRLRKSSAFLSVVADLRSEGWRDWHILMAVMNLTANLRVNALINSGEDRPEKAFEYYKKKLGKEEAEDEPTPPAELFTVERLRDALQTSYLSTLKQHGFTVNQRTPDFPAIEKFLRYRYHYWELDVEHEDPFIEAA